MYPDFCTDANTYKANITSSICILIPYVYGNKYYLFENNVDHTDTYIYLYSNIHIPILMHAAAGLILLLNCIPYDSISAIPS